MTTPIDPDEFFAARGYHLVTEEEDGYWWAHLVVDETGQVLVRRYGRAGTEADARVRAMQRWVTEQAT